MTAKKATKRVQQPKTSTRAVHRVSTEPDPLSGMTDDEIANLADELYEQRNDPDAWENEPPAEISADVRSVVSVRFSRGELGRIERAAREAGMPVSTYIRSAAMAAAAPVNVEELRGAVQELRDDLARDLARISRQLGIAGAGDAG
jgi:predicted DNA binding CopG/RHH family protein